MDEQQILSLFHEYSNMVYRLAYSYLRSPQDAEDLVQTVFLKLIDGKALPKPGSERAFLTRITINCCKDQLRSAWRSRTVPMDDTIPFRHSEDRELFHAVMELPEKYRIVIYLHYYEGYTFPEIARFLNISPSGVSMRMHRARTILQKQLRREGL
ncbi:MAG: sigma-70 family RNA polymerase sigma factor [Lachnospiraceae bacterium]